VIQWTFSDASINEGKRFFVDPETSNLAELLKPEIEEFMDQHGIVKYPNKEYQVITFGAITLYFPSEEVLVEFKLRFT